MNELTTKICDKMHEKAIVALCKTDQMLICSECLKQSHLEHNRVFTSTLAKNMLSYAQEVLNCVDDAVQNFDCIFNSLNKDDVIALLKTKIEEAFETTIQKLVQYKEKVLEDLISSGLIKEIILSAQSLNDNDKALKILQKEIETAKHEIQELVDQKDYMRAIGLHNKLGQYDSNIGELGQQVNECTVKLQQNITKVQNLAQEKILQDLTIDKIINQQFLEKLQFTANESKMLDCTVTKDAEKCTFKQELGDLLIKIENTHGKEIMIYNISNNSYHNLKFSRDFKVPLNFALIEHPCDSTVYITGGWLADKYRGDTYEYSLIKGKISKRANMKFPRRSHAGVYCRMPIVCGGENSDGHLSSCETFDYSKNVWIELPSLTEKKSYCSACSLGEAKIYVFGGYFTNVNGITKKFDTIEFLDLSAETMSWKPIKLLKKGTWSGRQDTGCVQISPSEIMIFGGYGEKSKKDAMIFNTDSLIVENVENLPNEESFYQRNPKCVLEKVYVLGGNSGTGGVFCFDLKTKKWSKFEK